MTFVEIIFEHNWICVLIALKANLFLYTQKILPKLFCLFQNQSSVGILCA